MAVSKGWNDTAIQKKRKNGGHQAIFNGFFLHSSISHSNISPSNTHSPPIPYNTENAIYGELRLCGLNGLYRGCFLLR